VTELLPCPTPDEIRLVAVAICKSRTCEGVSCCQWPANMGRLNCNAKIGGYDDAARDAIAAWNRRAVPQDGSAVEVADVNVVNALRYYIEHEADFTPRDRIAIAHRAIAALRACGVEP
jgi:hypothetical protein